MVGLVMKFFRMVVCPSVGFASAGFYPSVGFASAGFYPSVGFASAGFYPSVGFADTSPARGGFSQA